MTGPGQVRKKRGIGQNIWLGFVILFHGFWLYLLILYQFPLRIVFGYILVIGVGIIIPKKFEKLYCGGLILVFVTYVIWVFLPEKQGDWHCYFAGEELAAKDTERRIPARENAATIYAILLEDYDHYEFLGEFRYEDDLDDVALTRPWVRASCPEVASWLEERNGVIESLIEAGRKEKCAFPVGGDLGGGNFKVPRDLGDLKDSWDGQRWRLTTALRDWAKLLIWSANLDLGEGRNDIALEKIITLLIVAEHNKQGRDPLGVILSNYYRTHGYNQLVQFLITSQVVTQKHLDLIDDILKMEVYEWGEMSRDMLDMNKLEAGKSLAFNFFVGQSEGVK